MPLLQVRDLNRARIHTHTQVSSGNLTHHQTTQNKRVGMSDKKKKSSDNSHTEGWQTARIVTALMFMTEHRPFTMRALRRLGVVSCWHGAIVVNKMSKITTCLICLQQVSLSLS